LSKQLDELVGHVPQRSDEDAARVTLVGRALSRSDRHLHLATSTGVLAVPLSDIEDVTVRFRDDPTRVSVTVRGGRESVRLLRRGLAPRQQQREEPPPIVIIGPGVRTTVCTTTYTDGGDPEGEMCDDEDCRDSQDDEFQ
jgi:hypothetical protein